MVKRISLAAACCGALWAVSAVAAPPTGAPPAPAPPAPATALPPTTKPEPKPKLATKTPSTPVSAQSYLSQLRQAEQQLSALEESGDRSYGRAVRLLPPTAVIRRDDGQVQSAAKGDLQKSLTSRSGTKLKPGDQLTKRDVRLLRDNVWQRRRALEDWLQKHGGNYYQDTDAKRIIAQLEKTGQIRTGPTAFQQWWADAKKWLRDLIDRIARAIFGSSPKSPVKFAPIDPAVLRFIFYSAIFSLLVAIAYFLWKALGGRWKRSEAERHVRYLEGEDAELLRLPPDELRERAARFASAGNYREALRHLYIAVLVKFDARGVWRYDTRRTNWEHIQALKNDRTRVNLVSPMSDLTRRFDRVRYGDAPASQTDWQRFERDVQTVDGLLDNGQFTTTARTGEVRR